MTLNRDWATPLTIGAFALMAVTGLLMFFNLAGDLNKLAHEWLSWVMVTAVALHATVNWQAFKRHLLGNATGRAILVLSALVIAGSFVALPGQAQGDGPPPMLALCAVMSAPLATVAPLTGRSVTALLTELKQAGMVLAGPEQSLASVVGGDRGREAVALNILFKPH